MTKPSDSQWRATPAFNAPYENLVDCVAAAIKHFLRRRSIIFVMLYCGRRNVWYLMPWSQYRHIPAEHEASTAATVFRGDFLQLRSIAQSFPLDMFADEPSDDGYHDSSETPSAPDGAEKTIEDAADSLSGSAKDRVDRAFPDRRSVTDCDSASSDKETQH